MFFYQKFFVIIENKRQNNRKIVVVEPYRVNDLITASVVKLVGDNVSVGVYALHEALTVAKSQGLDLVEISPNVDPPICKVIDYSKFRYDQKRKQKDIKAKSQKVVIKEIRFTPSTDDHDFNFKLKHAIKFLKDGVVVKVFMNFARNQLQILNKGELILLNFAKALEEYSKIDQLPSIDDKKQGGRVKMLLTLFPKNVKN